jgi:hypothetical protein
MMQTSGTGEGADRRKAPRARVDGLPLFCNKHANGHPYLAEIVDVGRDGLLLRTTAEPTNLADHFAIELEVPGNPNKLWLWARTVRKMDDLHAIELVGTDLFDRACLAQLVRWRG